MAQGKFSSPRPHREEEREIEEAFRQITGQAPAPQRQPSVQSYTQPQTPPRQEPESFYDLIPEDSDFYREEPMSMPLPEELREEEDFLDKLMAFFTKNRQMVLVGLCAAALVLIISVVAVLFLSGADTQNDAILDNVYIGTVSVGGMTEKEASAALSQLAALYSQTDMVVNIGTTTLTLSPRDTGAQLNIPAVVEAAYHYGRTGTKAEQEAALESSRTESHIIGLLPYLELDHDYIRSTLEKCSQDSGSTLTQTSYGLEGEEPELTADKFDPNAPGQTLVITMGTPGIGFDAASVYNMVLDAYSLTQFQVMVETVTSTAEPDPIDLVAILDEFYIAPRDASVDMQTFEPIPGAYGYSFNLEAAQKLVDDAEYGEIIRIPMEYIAPEVLDETILFRDVIGEGRTPHSNNQNRTTNLRLACEALNGKVLNPGETLSFNETLGQRTSAKGYKEAPSYANGDVVDSLGGGICQVSSTLYYATLLADLDIVARTNHSYPSSYIDYGLDATVSWGGPDFKFRNSTNYPIRIEAFVEGGYVNVRILGTAEKDYYIQMEYEITNTIEPEIEYQDLNPDNPEGYKDGDVIQEGVTGYYVKTYKLKYSIQNGKLLSRDFAANSQYRGKNTIIARIAPEPTLPPVTVPPATLPPVTIPPVEEPLPPVTEPVVEPSAPPTEPPAPATDPLVMPTETPVPPQEPALPDADMTPMG